MQDNMRKSGILLHISQLPGPYGIGTLGENAYKFIDFLKECKQTLWQILPIGPTTYGDSPYQTFSAFAGNPYFIDLDLLVSDGLLTKEDINNNINYEINDNIIDYGALYNSRFKILRIAYNNFNKNEDFYNFLNDNKYWLDDYSKFMVLKNYHNGLDWHEWDKIYWYSNSNEVNNFINIHKDDYYYWCFIQYKFSKQFLNLKDYANKSGIKIIGDMPIYVAYDSSDVWSGHDNFLLDEDLNMKCVAGVPPDAFSETGQLWGNPIYNYEKMKNDGYSWWLKRIEMSFKYFDYLRIDHFRGFEAYWEVPYGSPDARSGKWVKGPDYDLFDTINKKFGKLNIIAEDLGVITDEVRSLLDKCGYPGMEVLQFAFDGGMDNKYLPHNHLENYVCYPGTHDNETLVQWIDNLDSDKLKFIMDYYKINNKELIYDEIIKSCLASISDTCIIMYSDWLGLGSIARLNTPNTDSGNWVYRYKISDFNEEIKEKIKKLTKFYR